MGSQKPISQVIKRDENVEFNQAKTWDLIHTLFQEVDSLKKQTLDLKHATSNSKLAKEKTDVHFSPQKLDPNRGIQIQAEP